ncbi:MAG: hypothetical protein WAX69_16835 [Victivallales bacterium]
MEKKKNAGNLPAIPKNKLPYYQDIRHAKAVNTNLENQLKRGILLKLPPPI